MASQQLLHLKIYFHMWRVIYSLSLQYPKQFNTLVHIYIYKNDHNKHTFKIVRVFCVNPKMNNIPLTENH